MKLTTPLYMFYIIFPLSLPTTCPTDANEQKQGQLGKETSQASDRNLGYALWDLSTRIVKDKLGNDALESWNA